MRLDVGETQTRKQRRKTKPTVDKIRKQPSVEGAQQALYITQHGRRFWQDSKGIALSKRIEFLK